MKLNNEKESAVLDCGKKNEDAKTYNIPIKKEDKVGFLMLGSQPTTDSVRAWLHSFIQAAPNKGGPESYLFLYCGSPENGDQKNPLLQSVTKEINDLRKQGTLPKNLHIIPFTNQDADFIALLMARSDLTITRSGGATSMELLQLRQSKDIPRRKNCCTFIHSEAMLRESKIEKKIEHISRKGKYPRMPHEELRKKAIETLLRDEGIVLWESENAKYLQEKLQAEVVNPEFARQALREKFFRK